MERLRSDPAWQQVPAVRNDRVLALLGILGLAAILTAVTVGPADIGLGDVWTLLGRGFARTLDETLYRPWNK